MNLNVSLIGTTEAEAVVKALEAAGFSRQERLTSFVKKVRHADPFVPGFIAVPDTLKTFDQAVRHCGRHVFNRDTPEVMKKVSYELSQHLMTYAARWMQENGTTESKQ